MSGTETAKSAARAAAEWWAEQVGSPVFRQVRPNERDSASILTESLLGLLADRNPVPDGAGPLFAAELEKRIEDMLGRINHVSLGVDYGPDLELAEAAKAAGIHTGRFPIKTHMWLTKDYVTAALGYGAQSKLIWQAPDWVRPQCGSQHYIDLPDGDYKPLNEICPMPRFHDGDHDGWIPDPHRCAECGGTYTDHYGRPRGDYLGHSWTPAIPEVTS